jgi:negative regulator of flagellin synthesis FlgM
MKINETQHLRNLIAYQANEARPYGTHKQSTRRDELYISQEAKDILLQQNVGASDAARAQKIEELKERVSTGTYQVDSDKLAERILPYMLEVYGKRN